MKINTEWELVNVLSIIYDTLRNDKEQRVKEPSDITRYKIDIALESGVKDKHIALMADMIEYGSWNDSVNKLLINLITYAASVVLSRFNQTLPYETTNMERFNNLMNTIHYIQLQGYSFDEINLAINAIIVSYYKRIASGYTPYVDSKYHKQLLQPLGDKCNLYAYTISCLEGMNIDQLIQYYPLDKNIDKYLNIKDYNSSIKYLNEMKSGRIDALDENNNLTEAGASKVLMELYFSNKTIFEISTQIFTAIKYATGLTTVDLLNDFLSNYNEKEVKKSKFTVIK